MTSTSFALSKQGTDWAMKQSRAGEADADRSRIDDSVIDFSFTVPKKDAGDKDKFDSYVAHLYAREGKTKLSDAELKQALATPEMKEAYKQWKNADGFTPVHFPTPITYGGIDRPKGYDDDKKTANKDGAKPPPGKTAVGESSLPKDFQKLGKAVSPPTLDEYATSEVPPKEQTNMHDYFAAYAGIRQDLIAKRQKALEKGDPDAATYYSYIIKDLDSRAAAAKKEYVGLDKEHDREAAVEKKRLGKLDNARAKLAAAEAAFEKDPTTRNENKLDAAKAEVEKYDHGPVSNGPTSFDQADRLGDTGDFRSALLRGGRLVGIGNDALSEMLHCNAKDKTDFIVMQSKILDLGKHAPKARTIGNDQVKNGFADNLDFDWKAVNQRLIDAEKASPKERRKVALEVAAELGAHVAITGEDVYAAAGNLVPPDGKMAPALFGALYANEADPKSKNFANDIHIAYKSAESGAMDEYMVGYVERTQKEPAFRAALLDVKAKGGATEKGANYMLRSAVEVTGTRALDDGLDGKHKGALYAFFAHEGMRGNKDLAALFDGLKEHKATAKRFGIDEQDLEKMLATGEIPGSVQKLIDAAKQDPKLAPLVLLVWKGLDASANYQLGVRELPDADRAHWKGVRSSAKAASNQIDL
ncbi:MAG: hypothetical protein IT381_07810 [Deltaproteobacteria bacterium]|nr:hypothetical protein [Deltaproteobacteria bacterium]